MASIRLDKVVFSTFHEAYKNYATSSDEIVISPSALANSSSREASVTIPYTRGGTRADIYATGSITGFKTLANAGGRASAFIVYDPVSSETATFAIDYNPTEIVVKFIITNNTGGSISPTSQTITIDIVQYDAPITPI